MLPLEKQIVYTTGYSIISCCEIALTFFAILSAEPYKLTNSIFCRFYGVLTTLGLARKKYKLQGFYVLIYVRGIS